MISNDQRFVSRLPHITVAFWVLKITATTLGETGGDWLSMTMKLGYGAGTAVFLGLFVAALTAQMRSRKHHPLLFWTVIIATSTAGTTISDYMDRTLGLGYTTGSAILVGVLLITLALWRVTIGNVAVTDIRTRGAEVFYWATILFSNTLGTALGDFLADDSGLGFLGSWLAITGVLLLVLVASKWSTLNKVLLFWIAFILTRPFGATFGDVLTKPAELGGIDLGRGSASLVLLGILLLAIAISSRSKNLASGRT